MNFNPFTIIVFISAISFFGTVLGGGLGVIIKNPTRKNLGNTIGFSAGLMLSIVMLQLIPEAVKWNFYGTIIFCSIGIMIFLVMESTYSVNIIQNDTYKKTAFLAIIAIMLHNLPEGIIMGCGFSSSQNIGIEMAIAIAIHDIPEGIAVAASMVAANVNKIKIMMYTIITALPTVIGAIIGVYIGSISKNILGISIAIASGVMLYVICGEMIPESNKLWKGKSSNLATILGIILGIIITEIF